MLHVVHHPGYVSPAAPGSRFRFDKYGLVLEALRGSAVPYRLHSPEPMPIKWLKAVHAPGYVDEVIAAAVPREKERRIGFPVTAHAARRARLVPAGTWLAARLALRHGYAANLAGGSHHARRETGAGYCVFNDLAIAAHRLLSEGEARRVMIVDLDVHQGDGTAMLMADRPDVFTFSIHAERNFPFHKAQSCFDLGLPDNIGDESYLALLDLALEQALDSFVPDLLLYQAGVDPHVDDRLGRLALSDAGLEARDRLVIAMAAARGIAVASTLGGGYGEDRMAIARRHVRGVIAMAAQQDGLPGPCHYEPPWASAADRSETFSFLSTGEGWHT